MWVAQNVSCAATDNAGLCRTSHSSTDKGTNLTDGLVAVATPRTNV